MTTTNILLTLIAVLLAVRIVLQVWQGKRELKHYCAPSEVEHTHRLIPNSTSAIQNTLNAMSLGNWEFVGMCSGDDETLILFFTRKKIKNYYEE